MAAYRPAILHGNGPLLSACFVHHYLNLTVNSYKEARQQADRLNAVIVARLPVKGAQQ